MGGCLLMSAVFDPMYERLTDYYRTIVSKTPNIKVKLNTTVDYRLVKAEKPAAVIVAVGGVPLDINVPGVNGKNVVRSHDFLELLGGHPPQKSGLFNKIMFNAGAVFMKYFYSAGLLKKMMAMKWPFGKRVAIIGGGLPGCDLAVELGKHNRQLAIFEEGKRVGYDVGASDRFHTISQLREKGVQMEPLTKVLAITDKGVKAVRADKTEVMYEADSVAVTLGFRKNMDLVDELQGLVPEIYAIGDCVNPQRMADANKQGYRAAVKI